LEQSGENGCRKITGNKRLDNSRSNCAYLQEFEKEKIVYNDICQNDDHFSIDKKGYLT
jgi:hypothetical protein